MKTINTNVLRTMCEIHYSFNEFMDALKKLDLSDVKKTSLILEKIVNKQTILGNKELKAFANRYEMELEEINKLMSVKEFIEYAITHQSEMKYFHEYLEDNEVYMYKIREVLDKIIVSIPYLNELSLNTSLSRQEGSVSTILEYNQNYKFFDNMKYIPNYEGERVSYVSFNPAFVMNINVNNAYTSDRPLECTSLVVSSLTFDPALIPDEITDEETFDKILELAKDRKESQALRNIINTEISLIDLEHAYAETAEFVKVVENAEDKKELLMSLRYIRAAINKYKETADAFIQKQYDSSEVIDEKLVNKEKMLYVKRRTWSAYNQDNK